MEQSLKQQNEERALAVLQARRAGSTRAEVAIQQGVSRQRVRQLECRGLELEIEP
jgi:DNA-directed RNA polymerase sigma subunit (sigma70/sigma32)